MAVKTKIPTSNINDYDIMDTISVSSWPKMFSEDANINADSKHKPVVLDDVFCQDISTNISYYKAKWWQANDGFCGWKPASLSGKYSSTISTYDGKRNGWKYVPPASKGTPLRQNDFAGYYHNARPMFNSISAPSEISLENTSLDVSLSVPSDDDLSLNITDFDVLEDYSFCVLIYNSDTNNCLVIPKSGSIWNTRKITIEPKTANLRGGTTYKIIPAMVNKILSNQTYYKDQSSWAESAYTIPNVSILSLYVKQGITIDFGENSVPPKTWARKYDDGEGNYYVEFNVTIWQDSGSQMTINSGTAVLRYKNASQGTISTINFITSATNVPNETWRNIGERMGDEGFRITEEQYNRSDLEVYIGLQGNSQGYLYGVTVDVTDN